MSPDWWTRWFCRDRLERRSGRPSAWLGAAHRDLYGGTVILPRDRDPRLITVRRGGTLEDCDHRLLALWAAVCAEHVLHLFESVQPSDPRPRLAIEQVRAWA